MIVPGFDRIDGTAVNGEVLNSDELWQEHTNEILELWEAENSSRSPEDFVSMMEFCAPFASGSKMTRAMRRALVSKEWTVDDDAVRLLQEEAKSKQPSPAVAPAEGHERSRRRRVKEDVIARTGTAKPIVPVPGIVLAAGGGFVYDVPNSAFRKALQRFRDILEVDGLYVTPDHACHVTIGTLQKYSRESPTTDTQIAEPQACVKELRQSSAFLKEVALGPVRLIVDRISVPEPGNSIILQFRDPEQRFEGLRNAVKSTFEGKLHDLRVPEFVHSTVARITKMPACSRSIMEQRLSGIFEGLEVEINSIDLVLEDREPYLSLFPDGSIGHWMLGASGEHEHDKDSSTQVCESPTRTGKEDDEASFLSILESVDKDPSSVKFTVLLFAGALAAWWFAEKL